MLTDSGRITDVGLKPNQMFHVYKIFFISLLLQKSSDLFPPPDVAQLMAGPCDVSLSPSSGGK